MTTTPAATHTDHIATLESTGAPLDQNEPWWLRLAPWSLVLIAIIWGLVELRPELRAVPYLDDSSIHQQMVRFASMRWSHGHLPLTSWFPYLGLGSPQFLHYQSLPSMITGLFGTFMDPDTAFRWSMYLLLALWPLVIYWTARVFGLGRWTAGAAALVAPLLESWAGIGYEDMAYIWRGYGVWTQLWASWTLPLAWAFTFRALDARNSVRRSVLPAVVFIMLTVGLHFETGYLAFVAVIVFPFLVPSDLRRRLVRAVLVGGSALLASAWVIVPVLTQSHWAARNQVLAGTGLENGYGARQLLDWLFRGQLFDRNHWIAVITIFGAVGIGVCIARWRTFVAGRALVAMFVVTMLMTFGRTTFGGFYSILPGSSDVFIRRFQMGMQLSGILLAGIGLVFVGRLLVESAAKLLPAERRHRLEQPAGRALVAAFCVVGAVVVLIPAWTSMDTYNTGNAVNVAYQANIDASQGPALDSLLAYVKAHPRGRVYAGQPTNWGNEFAIGEVPVFKYLESKDIDEVGYTLRTASLMTDPEFYFDDTNPGDYPLFGIGYLLTPASMTPPVPAEQVRCEGDYCLWALPDPGYFHVYDTTGVLDATRADVGTKSVPLLDSSALSDHQDKTVAFNGGVASPPTAPAGTSLTGSPGHVVVEHASLAQGSAGAVVKTNRRATVVLSASYDPGWTVTVNGHPEPTVMVAPALVGVDVGPGVHTVRFSYGGYGTYTLLFLLALLVFAALAVVPSVWRRSRRTTTV
ncbi:MAG TPA: YfhO family protein [Acidimicrobiales bacterium]